MYAGKRPDSMDFRRILETIFQPELSRIFSDCRILRDTMPGIFDLELYAILLLDISDTDVAIPISFF
jgi:riboflavin synthase